MAYPVSSPTTDKSRGLAMDTRKRLEKCWTKELDWGLYPEYLKEVWRVVSFYLFLQNSWCHKYI